MAAAAILKIEKAPYLDRSFSDFNEIWQVTQFGLRGRMVRITNLKFKKSKMAAADSLKNFKITISRQRFDRLAQHLA